MVFHLRSNPIRTLLSHLTLQVLIILTAGFVTQGFAAQSCLSSLTGNTAVQEVTPFLRMQAQQVGLPIQLFPVLYRFDGRAPVEIRAAGGFTPNPNKPAGDLQEHVKSGSLGTDRFVSFTVLAENSALFVEDNFLIERARTHNFPSAEYEQRFRAQYSPEGIAELNRQATATQAELFRMLGHEYDPVWFQKHRDASYTGLSVELRKRFDQLELERDGLQGKAVRLQLGYSPPRVLEYMEYRATNIHGVDTSSIGVEREREVVTDRVPNNQINAFRKVYLVFLGDKYSILPERDDEFYLMRMGARLKDLATRPDVVYGEWEGF